MGPGSASPMPWDSPGKDGLGKAARRPSDNVATAAREALTKCQAPGSVLLAIELAVDGARGDSEQLRREVLVAFGLPERLADDAQLDLLHRRAERHRQRATLDPGGEASGARRAAGAHGLG